MTVKELFDFVTDGAISDVDEYLEKLMEIASQRTVEDVTNKEKVEEEASGNNSNCGIHIWMVLRAFSVIRVLGNSCVHQIL